VFKKRVLRRIFGPNREEVAGSWKRLHNEELHTQIEVDDISGTYKTHGRDGKCIK
jgi:hypothetical protein